MKKFYFQLYLRDEDATNALLPLETQDWLFHYFGQLPIAWVVNRWPNERRHAVASGADSQSVCFTEYGRR